MFRSSLLILLFFSYYSSAGEKIYSRTYSLTNFYSLDEGAEFSFEIKKYDQKSFTKELKKQLKKNFISLPDSAKVVLNQKARSFTVSADLETVYKISEIFNRYMVEAAQIKFHVELVEIPDNDHLLHMAPAKITGELINSIPDNKKTIKASFDLLTQNGSTAVIITQGNTFEATPQVDPDGTTIEVEYRWMAKGKTFLSCDTRFKTLDRGTVVTQVQSSDGKNRKNLYLLISTLLVNSDMKPVPRFLKQDITKLQKKIYQSNKNKITTQYYRLSLPLGSDNSELVTGFKNLLLNQGVKFEKNGVNFSPGLMSLSVTAKVSELLKVDNILRDIGIETPQAKVSLRIVQIDNSLLNQQPGQPSADFIRKLPKAKVKILENYEVLSVSGKTAMVYDTEGPKSFKGFVLESTIQFEPELNKISVELKTGYQRKNVDSFLEQRFSLHVDESAVMLLQNKAGESTFLIFSARPCDVETKYW